MKKELGNLSTNEAMLLQWLGEVGEEELGDIAKEMNDPRPKVMAQLTNLKKRGLVSIRNKYGEVLVSLSNQGKQIVNYLWPDMYTQGAFS